MQEGFKNIIFINVIHHTDGLKRNFHVEKVQYMTKGCVIILKIHFLRFFNKENDVSVCLKVIHQNQLVTITFNSETEEAFSFKFEIYIYTHIHTSCHIFLEFLAKSVQNKDKSI